MYLNIVDFEVRSVMEKDRVRRSHTTARTSSGSRTSYIEGNTVRKLSVVEMPERRQDKQVRNRPTPVQQQKRIPVQEQKLGFGTVLMVTVCALAALWICAGYLQLQAENTRSLKQIASLENQLAELKVENKDQYNRLMSSVNLDQIREIAIHELGMVYANPDQIVLYDGQTNDYVRQYAEVPQETGTWLDGILGSK